MRIFVITAIDTREMGAKPDLYIFRNVSDACDFLTGSLTAASAYYFRDEIKAWEKNANAPHTSYGEATPCPTYTLEDGVLTWMLTTEEVR